jgi:capsular polysaccharide export protein
LRAWPGRWLKSTRPIMAEPSPHKDEATALVVGALLWKTPRLAAFFPEFRRLERRPSAQTLAVLGPADGPDAARAERMAARLNVRRWIVRDGPLHSVATGAPPLSLIAEPADGPPRLAELLTRTDWETPALLAEVRTLMALKKAVGLTEEQYGQAASSRSPEAVFAATFILTPRYVDPLTGKACSPLTAFQRLAAFRRHADRVRGAWTGLNIPPAKHGVMRAFLSGPLSTFKPYASTYGQPADEGQKRFANWASQPNAKVRHVLAAAPGQVTNIEDGFIRSVGLGSSFHPASSLVLDQRGIYYDPTRPSDLEHLLNSTQFDAETLSQAGALRDAIIEMGLSKYNLTGRAQSDIPKAPGRRTILVPGQVEDDASVLTGGAGLSNLGLLERVRQSAPDARILYKAHPDVTAGNRKGRLPEACARALADVLVDDHDILACIAAADEVHTLTSLTGFEALLRGKPVTTYGRPFYGGWGLTTDRGDGAWPERRRLTLDELVAGALILYPLYLDPVTWLPCDALTFVNRLRDLKTASPAARPRGRILRIGQGLRTTLWPRRAPAY